MNTIIIKGSNWYKNTDVVNTDMQELNEAVEICYKKDMEVLRKAHYLDRPQMLINLARKYPHHVIPTYKFNFNR